jgi:hypothetical protein
MLPQTIRRYCTTAVFEAIASGERTFDLRADGHDIQVGDFYLFVERNEEGALGRQIYRRVSYIVRLNELDDKTKDNPNGLTAVSFISAEHMTLEGLFADNVSVVAYAFEKFGGEVKIAHDPTCIPLLTVDGVNPYQINDFLHVENWPDGQYSITLRCHIAEVENDGTQDLTIVERLVMVRTKDEGVDKLVCVDHRFLTDGHLRDLNGKPIEAEFGELTYERHDNELDSTTLDRIMEIADQ